MVFHGVSGPTNPIDGGWSVVRIETERGLGEHGPRLPLVTTEATGMTFEMAWRLVRILDAEESAD